MDSAIVTSHGGKTKQNKPKPSMLSWTGEKKTRRIQGEPNVVAHAHDLRWQEDQNNKTPPSGDMWHFTLLEMDTRDRPAAQGTMSCDLEDMMALSQGALVRYRCLQKMPFLDRISGGETPSQCVSVGVQLFMLTKGRLIEQHSLRVRKCLCGCALGGHKVSF